MIDLDPAEGISAASPSAADQERYCLLFEQARDIVLFLRPDGALVDANPAAVAAYGYDRDALLAMNVAQLRAPESMPSLADQLRRAGDGGLVFETRHRRRDGSLFPVEVSSHPIALDGERLLMSIVRDISQRRRTEERLRDTEGKLLALFEAGVVGIVWGEEELIVEANDAFLALLGYDHGDLPLNWREMTPPDLIAESIAEVEASKVLGRFAPFEKRFTRKGGGSVPVLLGGTVLNVEPYRFIAFVLDARPQIEAETALALAADRERAARTEAEIERARLRDLFEQAPALVAVLRGRDGVCELFNARFRQLWGDRDVVGKPMREAWPELEGQGYFELVERVIETGEPEVRTGFPAMADWDNDGTPTESFFDFVYAPYRNPTGEIDGVTIIGFEVTGEVRARRDAEQAVQLRDEFLASASHDLKTPLTAILGRTQLLQRLVQKQPEPDPKLGAGLAAIRDVAAQMAAQIDELQDVARLRIGQTLELRLARTDLAEMVHAAVGRLGVQAAEHRLAVSAEPGLLADVDPVRLGRVLDNLLTNAVKYSRPGSAVEVGLCRDGEQAVLTVRDEGIGIPAADLPRIFERYHRGANASRFVGAGIGLAGSKRIVEQHGGTIAAESSEGVGSAFAVRLPLAG